MCFKLYSFLLLYNCAVSHLRHDATIRYVIFNRFWQVSIDYATVFFRIIEHNTLLRHLSLHNFSRNGTDNGNNLPYIINFETMDNNVIYFS